MSKPFSGHFSNTTGAKKAFNYIKSNRSPSDIIAERTKDLDLREHPITYKSSTPIRDIVAKIKNRTATMTEYKKYSQYLRLQKRRKEAIKMFWHDERTRIIENQATTRVWNKEQREAIVAGLRPKYNGFTIQGHHAYCVSKYPHLADKSAIIYPVTFHEHLYGWHGGNFKKNKPGKPFIHIKDF